VKNLAWLFYLLLGQQLRYSIANKTMCYLFFVNEVNLDCIDCPIVAACQTIWIKL
jgi:hypothetical protein